jgi:colicin import membrane protein
MVPSRCIDKEVAMNRLVALAGASLLLACASQKAEAPKAPQVADADYGRLTPEQMAIVEAARRNEVAARNDLARAQLRLKEADHEAELAQADAPAVEADQKRAAAEAKMANESRAPDALDRAQAAKQGAEIHEREAKAHADYAAKLKQACQAEATAVQRRLEASTVKVDQAKLQALQSAAVPAAEKYDASSFERAASDAAAQQAQAEAEALGMRQQAVAAERQWEALQQQLRAKRSAMAK